MTNMPELEFIQISIPEEAIVAITLNRPPVNAFNPQMYHEVKLALSMRMLRRTGTAVSF